ncbi:hypothetical protein T01_1848 [Trichinella spiralis]|uniref:Uncharacterized protein n=1 Tax=Trichinella spiralis TaxID=6334 RepID=A0A0V1AHU5_TRISP|nr:hypothetical protein T01_1848 [Trichinella spiralis]
MLPHVHVVNYSMENLIFRPEGTLIVIKARARSVTPVKGWSHTHDARHQLAAQA